MYSKVYCYLLRAISLWICALLLFQCNDDDGIGNSRSPSLSPDGFADQVNQLVQGITFVGDLPNGQSLNFSAGGNFAEIGDLNYAETLGPNFTSFADGMLVNASEFSGSGKMKLGPDDVTFQFVWCTSYGELRRRYPSEFMSSPQFDHWMVYMGIGQANYSEKEILEGSYFNVDDYIGLTVDPHRSDNRLAEGVFFSKSGGRLSLFGTYELNFRGMYSEGSAHSSFSQYSPYSVELTCGN